MKIKNMTVQVIKITNSEATQRIDNFLRTRLKGVPKSLIYRLIRTGKIRINHKHIKSQYKLAEGDLVHIPPLYVIEKKVVKISNKNTQVTTLANCILYEDNYLLVINKPSGTAVHGGSGLSFGVIEGLRILWPEVRFLQLVHRLDRETSGALLVAKKRSVLKLLHEQLRMKKIKKDYLALVRGRWSCNCNTVQAPLLKKNFYNGKKIMKVSDTGKISKTNFTVKAHYKFATLVKASPITGRTHQIRVHALHAGHPIAFDQQYGDREFDKKLVYTGLKRLFLHAAFLKFEHPETKKIICIDAPIDEELQYCLNKLN